jgi:carboxylesterase type B
MTTACTVSGPYIDKEIAPQTALEAVEKGQWTNVPTIFGCTQDEGTDFVPKSLNSTDEIKMVLKSIVPSLSASSLQLLVDIYVNNASEPVFPGAGKYWRNAANIYGEIGFECVDRLFQLAISKQKGKTWKYRYGVKDPEREATGEGTSHGTEKYAVWGVNNTDDNPPKSYLTTNAGILPVVQRYWISFINHLDPNKGRLEGTAKWPTWDEEKRRIGFVADEGKGWAVLEQMDYEKDRRCRIIEPLMRAVANPPPEGQETVLVWLD